MKRTDLLAARLLVFSMLLPGSMAQAQFNITSTGLVFAQDFNGMGTTANTNTTSTLSAGFRVSSGTDWATGTTATTAAGGTSGTGILASNSAGGAYNFAQGVMSSSTDRALGFLTSGSFTSPRSIILQLANNTGVTINQLDIALDYEKYRSGTRQVDWSFFHGSATAPTSAAAAGNQTYVANANTTTVSNPPATTAKSFSLTGLSIPNGANYYLRWTYTGLAGSTNTQAIGIDNFSITAIQDTDGDGVPDGIDPCPLLANLANDQACDDGNACTGSDVVSNCTCAGTPLPDTDGDGLCDAVDNCPNLAGQQGCSCNDNNTCTINDVLNASCVCIGSVQDTDGDGLCNAADNCPYVSGSQGDACEDFNPCTVNDVISAACVCTGTFQDTDGDGRCDAMDNCPNSALPWNSPCDDGNPCTVGDHYSLCTGICQGDFRDTDGDGICDANDPCPFLIGNVGPGDPCNDYNDCTMNDVVVGCTCIGTFDPLYSANCTGNADGDALCDWCDVCPTDASCQVYGQPCNDNDPCTVQDVINWVGQCQGWVRNSDGDGICDYYDACPYITGEPGDPCDDLDLCTINDAITASCTCVGTFLDPDGDGICDYYDGCPNIPGAPNSPCDDGDPCTYSDVVGGTGPCVCGGTGAGDSDNDGTCDVLDDCPGMFGTIGSACDDCNASTINDVLTASCTCVGTPAAVLVSGRVFLEGPYSGGIMADALRSLGTVPLTDPYPGLGYVHTGGGNGGSVAPAVIAVGGTNAIVDWVLMELRSPTAPATILASRSALVQRDGDVVDMDGSSPVTFTIPQGNYYVAMRHRNHLGAMTANPFALSATQTSVDLTSPGTATYGINATKPVGGVQVLWAGDVTFNGQVKYTGSGNDRDPILTTVGSTTPNNTVSNSYSTRDVNLNGQVKYTGTANDRDPILVNVGSTTPNNVRVQQLP